VRSTDLLAMANVNPDSALGVQIQYEEDLTNQSVACFQAALLYTSSRGDRRIRVHTLCIPICKDIQQVFGSFDLKASVSLLSKMGKLFRFQQMLISFFSYGTSFEWRRLTRLSGCIGKRCGGYVGSL
jgi:hypothetical protein